MWFRWTYREPTIHDLYFVICGETVYRNTINNHVPGWLLAVGFVLMLATCHVE